MEKKKTGRVTMNAPKPNAKALLPIAIFLLIYLGNGIYFEYIHPVPDPSVHQHHHILSDRGRNLRKHLRR